MKRSRSAVRWAPGEDVDVGKDVGEGEDGKGVGERVGEPVGDGVVGNGVGDSVGLIVGDGVGDAVGLSVGEGVVGDGVGDGVVGDGDGEGVGDGEGDGVGAGVVGEGVGEGEGDGVGDCVVGDGVVGDGVVGDRVGDGVGEGEGDGVGDCVVGDGVVGDGDGDRVGEGVVGDGVGDCVVGDGVVGDGVGVLGPVHVTGGLHGPELRHAGHIAPSVQAGLGERRQVSVMWSLMAQMPTPAPAILLPVKPLRMCARKECAKGGERGERTTQREDDSEARGGGEDAQGEKLRELAERVRNSAADLVAVQ